MTLSNKIGMNTYVLMNALREKEDIPTLEQLIADLEPKIPSIIHTHLVELSHKVELGQSTPVTWGAPYPTTTPMFNKTGLLILLALMNDILEIIEAEDLITSKDILDERLLACFNKSISFAIYYSQTNTNFTSLVKYMQTQLLLSTTSMIGVELSQQDFQYTLAGMHPSAVSSAIGLLSAYKGGAVIESDIYTLETVTDMTNKILINPDFVAKVVKGLFDHEEDIVLLKKIYARNTEINNDVWRYGGLDTGLEEVRENLTAEENENKYIKFLFTTHGVIGTRPIEMAILAIIVDVLLPSDSFELNIKMDIVMSHLGVDFLIYKMKEYEILSSYIPFVKREAILPNRNKVLLDTISLYVETSFEKDAPISSIESYNRIIEQTGITNSYFQAAIMGQSIALGKNEILTLEILNKIGILDIIYRRVALSTKYKLASNPNTAQHTIQVNTANNMEYNGSDSVRVDDDGIELDIRVRNSFKVRERQHAKMVANLGISYEDLENFYSKMLLGGQYSTGAFYGANEGNPLTGFYQSPLLTYLNTNTSSVERFKDALIGENNIGKTRALVKRISRTCIDMSMLLNILIGYIGVLEKDIDWVNTKYFTTKAIELNTALSYLTGQVSNGWGNTMNAHKVFIVPPLGGIDKRFLLVGAIGTEAFLELISKHSTSSIHNHLDGSQDMAASNALVHITHSSTDRHKIERIISNIYRKLYNMGVKLETYNQVVNFIGLEKDAPDHIMNADTKEDVYKLISDWSSRMEMNMLLSKTGVTLDEIVPKKIDITDGSHGEYDIHFHSHNDVSVMKLGNITNCCQVFGGAAESCIIEGLLNPYSGFISIRDKGTSNVVAQSWIWLTDDLRTLVLDSIECRFPHKISGITESLVEWCKGQKYDIAIGAAYTKLDRGLAERAGFKMTQLNETSLPVHSLVEYDQDNRLKYLNLRTDKDLAEVITGAHSIVSSDKEFKAIKEKYQVFTMTNTSNFGTPVNEHFGHAYGRSDFNGDNLEIMEVSIANPRTSATRIVNNIYSDAKNTRYILTK